MSCMRRARSSFVPAVSARVREGWSVSSVCADDTSATADYLAAGTGWLEHGLTQLRKGQDASDSLREAHTHYAGALEMEETGEGSTPLERVTAHVGLTEVALAVDDRDAARAHWLQALTALPHDRITLGALSNRMRGVAERHTKLGQAEAARVAVELAEQALDGQHAWGEAQGRHAYAEGLRRLARGDVLGGERHMNIAASAYKDLSIGISATPQGGRHLRAEGSIGLTLIAIALGQRDIAARHFDRLMGCLEAADLAQVSARLAEAGVACAARKDDAGAAQAARFASISSSPEAAKLDGQVRQARTALTQGIELLGEADGRGDTIVAKAAASFRKVGRASGKSDDSTHGDAKMEAALGLTIAAIARGDSKAAEEGWREAKIWASGLADNDGWVRAWEVMSDAADRFYEAHRLAASRSAMRFAHQCFPTAAVRQARAQAKVKRSGARS